MSKIKFRISYSINKSLSVDALWPDGDAPENPTEEDVLALIEDEGGILKVIDDWNLDPHPSFNVDVFKDA